MARTNISVLTMTNIERMANGRAMKLLLEKIFGEKEQIKFNIPGYLFDYSKTFLNSKEEAKLLIVPEKCMFMMDCGKEDSAWY